MISDNAASVIVKGNELLPVEKGAQTHELEDKAATFLLIMTKLGLERNRLAQALLKSSSIEKATYAKVLFNCVAKTVQEKVTMAEADSIYQEAKESVGELKNDIIYVEASIDIFQNAHLLYRQMARQEKDSI